MNIEDIKAAFDELKKDADIAYCRYIDICDKECRGTEYHLEKGTFSQQMLESYKLAYDMYGFHRGIHKALKEVRTLLDQAIERSEIAPAINAPMPHKSEADFESLKREAPPEMTFLEVKGFEYAIDYLAPRIVMEGCVVVPVEVIKEINRLSKMNTSREYKESENYNYDEEDIGATFIDAYDMFVRDVRLLNKKLIAASKGD